MTPSSALVRLVNLRDQLTDRDEVCEIFNKTSVGMNVSHYSRIIDDLDDIIWCIRRGMHDHPMDMETVAKCDVCNPPPDSEDMERRPIPDEARL